MGFREDIPMDDFARSNPFLANVFGVTGTTSSATTFTIASPSPAPDYLFYSEPVSQGYGPVVRSTSQELEVWPGVVWDVNGYYHDLGVGFRATRKQLLAAYMQLNGQESERLTYVFKQLLDPEVRRKYDASPLGTVFIDRYVEDQLKLKAQEMARAWKISAEEILQQWGFEVSYPAESDSVEDEDPAQSPPEEPVDIPQESQEDGAIPPAPKPRVWPYAYYLWKIRSGQELSDAPGILERWQDAIAAECQRRKATIRFAVGLMGARKEGARFLAMSVDGATVVFISADHTHQIEELAPHAAHRLLSSEI